jgi:hypothetical protein
MKVLVYRPSQITKNFDMLCMYRTLAVANFHTAEHLKLTTYE